VSAIIAVTNSKATLLTRMSRPILTHCLGGMEYWGGYIVAGRPVARDRAAEFWAARPVSGLVERVSRARQQLQEDTANVDPFAPPRGIPRLDDVKLHTEPGHLGSAGAAAARLDAPARRATHRRVRSLASGPAPVVRGTPSARLEPGYVATVGMLSHSLSAVCGA
jgi:hypothetical protein